MSDKKDLSDLEKRYKSEQEAFGRVTNDDLVCKSCIFELDDYENLGNTSRCEQYDVKPNKVLLGGECNEYFGR